MKNKKTFNYIFKYLNFILLIFILAGCTFQQSENDNAQTMMNSQDSMDMAREDIGEEADFSDESGDTSDLDLGEKIIQTATLNYETTDFEEALDFVNQTIDTHEAKLAHTSRGESSATYGFLGEYISMTIRLPQNQLDPFIETLNKNDNLHNQHQDIGTDDATKIYRDNETRISVLKDEEEALREMLKVQEDLEEVLEIRTRLMEIITEREIFENENKNIDEQVDYSTVYLKIQQTNQAHIEPAKGFGKRIAAAFKDSFFRFIVVSQQAVIAFVYAIPYLIIIGILGSLVFFGIRKLRKK